MNTTEGTEMCNDNSSNDATPAPAVRELVNSLRTAPAAWASLVRNAVVRAKRQHPADAAVLDAEMLAYTTRTADELSALQNWQDELTNQFIADCQRRARRERQRRLVATVQRRPTTWARPRARTPRAAPVRRRGSRRCTVPRDKPGSSSDDDGATGALDLALAVLDAVEYALAANLGDELLLHLYESAQLDLLAALERRLA
jgi:hypothetical protein